MTFVKNQSKQDRYYLLEAKIDKEAERISGSKERILDDMRDSSKDENVPKLNSLFDFLDELRKQLGADRNISVFKEEILEEIKEEILEEIKDLIHKEIVPNLKDPKLTESKLKILHELLGNLQTRLNEDENVSDPKRIREEIRDLLKNKILPELKDTKDLFKLLDELHKQLSEDKDISLFEKRERMEHRLSCILWAFVQDKEVDRSDDDEKKMKKEEMITSWMNSPRLSKLRTFCSTVEDQQVIFSTHKHTHTFTHMCKYCRHGRSKAL